ncbi:MAG: DUF4138 domain-containing protein [Bacteroidales bacterium]|nr:DUF4138 domain-containing protein [Bacteroidales bacterium]
MPKAIVAAAILYLLPQLLSIPDTAYAHSSCGSLQVDTIYVNEHSTVHLRFSSGIDYVNIGHRSITARIAEGGRILAVKAVEEFSFTTSLTCLTSSGKLFAFPVRYGANTEEGQDSLIIDIPEESEEDDDNGKRENDGIAHSEMGEVTSSPSPSHSFLHSENGDISRKAGRLLSLPGEVHHAGKRHEGILAECTSIVREKDSLYVVIRIRNLSSTTFKAGNPSFSMKSNPGRGRRLVQERRISPVWIYGDSDTPPGKESFLVVCLGEITVGSARSLRVDFHEKDGVRNFGFGIYGKDLR